MRGRARGSPASRRSALPSPPALARWEPGGPGAGIWDSASPRPPLSRGPLPPSAAPGTPLQPWAPCPPLWHCRATASHLLHLRPRHPPPRRAALRPPGAPPPARSGLAGPALGLSTQAREAGPGGPECGRGRGGAGRAATPPGWCRRSSPGPAPRRRTTFSLSPHCCAASRDSTFKPLNATYSPILFPGQRFNEEKLCPPPRSRGIGKRGVLCWNRF